MGTHPIFESDFDCLTECIVLCCYSRVKAKSGYKNGSTQLPTKIARKCRVILSILYYSVDQKCRILLISWATKLSINDMLRSTFAALWIKKILKAINEADQMQEEDQEQEVTRSILEEFG